MTSIDRLSLRDLKQTLRQRGVKLWSAAGKLHFKAPEGAMTPDLQAALRLHKAALLLTLAQTTPAAQTTLVVDPQNRHQPFPMTDLQQAYWVGENGGYAQSSIASYVHHVVFKDLAPEKVQQAVEQLQIKHEVLRTRFRADGTQVIAPWPDCRVAINIIDLTRLSTTQVDAEVAQLAEDYPDTSLPHLSKGPPLAMTLVRGAAEDHLIFGLRLIVLDGPSLAILFHDFLELLHDDGLSDTRPDLGFRDYVLALGSQDKTQAQAYWAEQLGNLPAAPKLPTTGRSPKQSRFRRLQGCIAPESWQRLKAEAQKREITPNAMMLALYAATLRPWATDPAFTLNVLTNYRPFVHPQAATLVGNHSNSLLLACTGHGSFVDQARAVHAAVVEQLPHASVSGVSLLRKLQQSGQPDQPAVPFVFTSGLSQGGANVLPKKLRSSFRTVSSQLRTPQVWLDHQVIENHEGLVYYWDYVADIFPTGLPEAFVSRFEYAVEHLLHDEAAWDRADPAAAHQAELPPLVPAKAPPFTPDLATCFLKQVKSTPDAVALVGPDGGTLNYEQVAQTALKIAGGLRQHGVTSGDLVAVELPKSVEQVLAVIGVSMAGVAWLPLDPTLPPARRTAILRQSEVVHIINNNDDNPLAISGLCNATALQEPISVTAHDLAYVIYTSGSTGTPKGVAISHRAVLNTLAEVCDLIGLGADDRVLLVSALNFDLSVFDIWGSLLCGAACVLPPDRKVPDPKEILAQCTRDGVTVWNSVPAVFEMLFAQDNQHFDVHLSALRTVMLSGDWIGLSLASKILDQLPNVQFLSLGGATEASIWSNSYSITEVAKDWTSIPYGFGLGGQQLHILDDHQQPCLPFVTGEIYIDGNGLADGYYKDHTLTRQSFVQHSSGRRLYRTGDLGRLREGGAIEFLGRKDFQLKHNGFRIEAGDIETHLIACRGIQNAAVLLAPDHTGQTALVACCQTQLTGFDDVRGQLRHILPSYMVPSHIIGCDALPLTANGKRDRRALLEMVQASFAEIAHFSSSDDAAVAEDTPLIAALWADILQVKSPSNGDHFFQSGGNSMSAVRMIQGIEAALGIVVPLATIFEHPTLGDLWKVINCPAQQRGDDR